MNFLLQIISIIVISIPFVLARSPIWGQCGGFDWTGSTNCELGSSCVSTDLHYSQCIPDTVSSSPTPTPTYGSRFDRSGTPISSSKGTGLNIAARAAGKLYFGSATDNPEFTDAAYLKILNDLKEFGQITPGNSMKWDATEPTQGTFTFTQGDAVLNQAKANRQIVRGHTLVWYNQLPSWVTGGTWTKATLTAVIQEHINAVAGHYKGQVYAWDVVNEPLNDDGTFRSNVFYDVIGESYIAIALRAARAADPSAKLYINEYNIEGPGAKSSAMITLVKGLKAAGVPLDGVGIQCHLTVGGIPSNLQSNIAAFAALQVEVALTELDIRMTLPSTDSLLAQQQKDYQTVVSACNAVLKCVGITLWDFTDKYSWVPRTFSGQGAACPWDENLLIKPANMGILNGFNSGL